jgi:hypothetical protein
VRPGPIGTGPKWSRFIPKTESSRDPWPTHSPASTRREETAQGDALGTWPSTDLKALKGRHKRPPFNRPAPTGCTGRLGSALSGLGTRTDHKSQGVALGCRLSPRWGFKTDSESPHVHLGPGPKWSRFIPKTESSKDPWPMPSPASTRREATAQGNALGTWPSTDLKALKGRHNKPPFNRPAPTGFIGRLGSALSGLGTRTDPQSQGVALGYPLSPRWGAKRLGSGKECGGCGFPRGLGNR